MPAQVAASSGLDILSHAVESFTAMPYSERARPERPALRPAYQGSNPISDIWSLEAMRIVARYLVRAVEDPSDDEARANMLLAASYAEIGFGNAGVHLPHGMSYPVSGNVKNYRRARLSALKGGRIPWCPHGFSVILNAPAVFRFTASMSPGTASASSSRAGRKCGSRASARCGKNSRGSHHLVYAAAKYAEWITRDWLHIRRYSGTC